MKLSNNLKLYFHRPEIIAKVVPDKVQIAETDFDYDHTDTDIHVSGEGFPDDPSTLFFCRVGN